LLRDPMQMTKTNSHYWLSLILVLNVLSTGIHYFDNYVHFDQYPMPNWITQEAVWISWFVLTAIAGVGYWLYRQQQFWLAYACLAIYSTTGASTPGHYFYAPLNHFSTTMNAMILSDGLVSLLLIIFLIWSILVNRPWQSSALSN
jgi:hypothetical protein